MCKDTKIGNYEVIINEGATDDGRNKQAQGTKGFAKGTKANATTTWR